LAHQTRYKNLACVWSAKSLRTKRTSSFHTPCTNTE